MVRARLKISMLVTLAALASGVAHAADYTPPQVFAPPPPPPEFAGGWYLRGDIGFSNQDVGSLFNENYNTSGFSSVQNVDKSFDSAPFFGLGIGYTVNNWLRFDVTGEYRGKANFHGMDIGHTAADGDYPDRYSGSKSEWTFLLNGYLDLGTWYNLTPFVGAGVGFSRNTISNFGDINLRTGGDSYGSDASKWNFAWALYAGVGYQVTRDVTIELAYRYIDLGNATTGTMVSYDGSIINPPYEFNRLTSQDIKLGVRFNLGAGFDQPAPVRYYAPPQVYAPPPPAPPPLRSRG
jgi:opacity protein-like surface antigen